MSLRVLMLHSPYKSPGGEDESFRQEVELLREHGHDVLPLVRPASRARTATMASEALGLSQKPGWELIGAINRFQPDIVHLQNTFPRWGPNALSALLAWGGPVIAAVRNYRTWCPAGTAFRDGAPCTDCMGKPFAYPGIMHGCYRGSMAQSAVAATSLWLTDWSAVDHFIAVSEYVKGTLVDAGVAPASKISVKPNCVADPGIGDGSGGYALFIGDPLASRPEKGWPLLASAWAVAGLHGRTLLPVHGMPHAEVLDAMKRAAFVVVPSLSEPFGRVVIEAYACGTPVLATRMGGLPEIVDDGATGWLVDPNPEAMADGLERAFDEAKGRRLIARVAYEKYFTPESNYAQLMPAYARMMAARMAAREAAEPMGVQL